VDDETIQLDILENIRKPHFFNKYSDEKNSLKIHLNGSQLIRSRSKRLVKNKSKILSKESPKSSMQVLSISDTDQNSLSDIQSPEAPDLNVQSNLMLTAQRRNSFIPRRCKSKVMVSQPLKNAYKPSESIEKTKVSSRFRRQATRRGSITYSGQAMSHNHHRSVTHYSRS